VKQDCERMWPVFILLVGGEDGIISTASVSMNCKNLGGLSLPGNSPPLDPTFLTLLAKTTWQILIHQLRVFRQPRNHRDLTTVKPEIIGHHTRTLELPLLVSSAVSGEG